MSCSSPSKASRHVSVVVHGLQGEVCAELDATCNSKLIAVKRQLAAKLEIHPLCQQLIINDTVLEEDENGSCAAFEMALKDAAEPDCLLDNPVLRLSLVVSVEPVLEQLKSPFAWARSEALAALPIVPIKDELRIDACLACIVSPTECEDVKISAVAAVSRIAPRGNAAVIGVLLECRQPRYPAVVEGAAMDALALVANRGDVHVLDQLSLRLTSSADEELNVKVMKCLAQIVVQGDLGVTTVVLARASDLNGSVREQALLTLANAAPIGHKDSIKTCSNLLANQGEWHLGTKRAAIVALKRLVQQTDSHVTSMLCVVIEEVASPELRVEALHLLTQVAPFGHKYAARVLEEFAEDLK